MPAEAVRLQRRLGARDRWFIGLLALAIAVGAAAALAVGRIGSSDATARDGCVSITRASWMGAATYTACGADAASFCRKAGDGDEEVVRKCEEEGLATR